MTWDIFLQEVEFAVGPFGVTNQRQAVCDFSHAFYSENNAILMVRPTLQSDMAGFAKPFTLEVRIHKATLIVGGLVIVIFSR